MEKTTRIRDRIMQIINRQIDERRASLSLLSAYNSLLEKDHYKEDAREILGLALADYVYEAMMEGRPFSEEEWCRQLERVESGELVYTPDPEDYESPFEGIGPEDFAEAEKEDEPSEMLWEDLKRDNDEEELLDVAYAYETNLRTYDYAGNLDELCRLTAARMMEPEVFRESFLDFHDKEFEILQRLLENGRIELDDETDAWYDRISHSDYFHWGLDYITVSKEVQKAAAEFFTPEFDEERRHNVWIKDCLTAFKALFAAAPVSVLAQMYNAHPQYSADEEEIFDLVSVKPAFKRSFLRVNNEIRARELMDKKMYKHLNASQKNYEFSIPSCEETADIGQYLYPHADPVYQKMKDFLENSENPTLHVTSDEILKHLFVAACQDLRPDQYMQVFYKMIGSFIPSNEAEEFKSLLVDLIRNTRCLFRRAQKRPDFELDEKAFENEMVKVREAEKRWNSDDALAQEDYMDDIPF